MKVGLLLIAAFFFVTSSRISVEWNLNSRWMFPGHTSFGKDDSHTVLTGQVEGFYSLRNVSEGNFRAAVGGGVRWERDGGNFRPAFNDRTSVADRYFG